MPKIEIGKGNEKAWVVNPQDKGNLILFSLPHKKKTRIE